MKRLTQEQAAQLYAVCMHWKSEVEAERKKSSGYLLLGTLSTLDGLLERISSSDPPGMPDEKVMEAAEALATLLPTQHIERQRHQGEHPSRAQMYRHLLYMTIEVGKFIKAQRIGKAHRWLGFVQGAVWALGLNTIGGLKDMNRPT